MTTTTEYARQLLDGAVEYQVSNADCDWSDIEGMEIAEDLTADEWNEAGIRERLFDYGAADDRLQALIEGLAERIKAAEADPAAEPELRAACWLVWDYLTLDYGHEVETEDDLQAPPFAR